MFSSFFFRMFLFQRALLFYTVEGFFFLFSSRRAESRREHAKGAPACVFFAFFQKKSLKKLHAREFARVCEKLSFRRSSECACVRLLFWKEKRFPVSLFLSLTLATAPSRSTHLVVSLARLVRTGIFLHKAEYHTGIGFSGHVRVCARRHSMVLV